MTRPGSGTGGGVMVTSRKGLEAAASSFLFLGILSLWGCGSDGTGPDEELTGASLLGQVVLLGSSAQTGGVNVSIGNKKTKTSGDGSFSLNHIPLGNQMVTFSGSGNSGSYSLSGVESGSTFFLNDVQVGGGQVKTEHTGTWVGTAGSTEPGSQGQIAFTLTIQANGNALTGSASVPAPDNSIWAMSGKETGTSVDGEMVLVSSASGCATGATFTGTFVADTLSGDFVEVSPPVGCGTPESGTFRVVKQ